MTHKPVQTNCWRGMPADLRATMAQQNSGTQVKKGKEKHNHELRHEKTLGG